MFEAVIFDWDGTLADSKADVLASFHGALGEVVGFDVEDEFIERRIGVGAAWTFREILKSKGVGVDEAVIQRLLAAKVRIAIEEAHKVQLFPGARGLLESLKGKGKAKLGLASMNNRPIINHLLKKLDVAQFFDVVVTVDEVTKSKPDPQIFLTAAQKLKTLPERCVVLEDSIFGVKAAKAGGMACVAVVQGFYRKDELAAANPDLIVDSLREKKRILQFILH